MKHLLLPLILLVNTSYAQMILEHHFEGVGVGGKTINLPLKGPYDITIDWGDGSGKESFKENTARQSLFIINDVFISHSYSRPGTKTITIRGSLTGYGSASPDLDNSTLTRVLSWDGLGIKSFQHAFYNASNLKTVPGSLPASATNLSGMFSGAIRFNGSIGSWNTTNVTNMNAMFFNAISFNQPLADWNTSNVTNMGEMFSYARSFNQNIGTWNTSNVSNMSGMFNMALSFNRPIENWNTAKVKDMNGIFMDAVLFNQPIGKWNTGSLVDAYDMFNGAISFNQPIGNWNMSNVTSCNRMFLGAVSFNQPIGNWNTSNVRNMTEVFSGAKSFNQPIGNWNISKVGKMKEMFRNASSFDQDLSNWNLSAVSDKADMYWGEIKTLRMNGKYKNGHKVGKWNYYYDNGKLEASGNYDEKGNPQGSSWVFYDKSGKPEPSCSAPDDNDNIRLSLDIYKGTEFTGKAEGETRLDFEFQSDLWRFSCAFPSYNSFEVGKLKIQIMWLKNRERFTGNSFINSRALGLSVAKLDVESTQRLIFDATRRYHLDMNYIDPADKKTLLDFIRDRIQQEMQYDLIFISKVREYERKYYILKKYLDAKHASELK